MANPNTSGPTVTSPSGQNTETDLIELGSDAPQTDPALDAFGYAPFAKRIAEAVRKTPSPQGLVMAIHGPWGSGKSSLVNFVKHELGKFAETYKPIVIDFNPWWFNDRDHLATQFLSHFAAKLPKESQVLRGIGDTMADYSGALGKTVAVSTGIPFIDIPLGWLLKLLKRKPKDVPTLKAEIAAALRKANQRFVFVIDDIDRLTPDEIREIFKVIKALADFPDVIYLLSFDRRVVADALHRSINVDGEAYLEKIVQVPFALPAVDPQKLRKKLCTDLDRLLVGGDSALFDQTYWGNVFIEGIAPLLKRPRDVVRFVNALSVTFPTVLNEVNPVDFIALEFVRLRLPKLYDAIRENPDQFVGYAERGIQATERKEEREFHEAWAQEIDANIREGVQGMMERIFPRITNMGRSSEFLRGWRTSRRACHPDVFPTYFQFSVNSDQLSRRAMIAFIAALNDQTATEGTLLGAIDVKRIDGTSQAKDYLEQLLDYDKEIDAQRALTLLRVLTHIGDRLINVSDSVGGMIPSAWRLIWILQHALNRIAPETRDAQLIEIFRQGDAVTFICLTIDAIEKSRADPVSHGPAVVLSNMNLETVVSLKEIALGKIKEFAKDGRLLKSPELPFLLKRWGEWDTPEAPSTWAAGLLDDEATLFGLLAAFLSHSRSQTIGDAVGRSRPTLNLKLLAELTDLDEIARRLPSNGDANDLSAEQSEIVTTFMAEHELVKQGKDPSNPFVQLGLNRS